MHELPRQTSTIYSSPGDAHVVQTTNRDITSDLLDPENTEYNLWLRHPSSSAFLAKQTGNSKKINKPSFDIGTPTLHFEVSKDIGDTPHTSHLRPATDGERGKLKLKCCLVPHGNRHADKDSVRTDSSTAQCACIGLLLSIATIFHISISSLDISGAYLQAGELGRDIYMRPPRGWTSFIDEVGKLVKPPYGLVESGRLWQICIERWFQTYGLDTIPGMPQLFVLRCEKTGHMLLLVAKVVDDLLLAGVQTALSDFRVAITKRFKVGRYTAGSSLIFNRLHIECRSNGDVFISIQEFFDTIDSLPISRARRKQQNEPATPVELRSLQALAGKLNYLGHGILPQTSLVASKMQQFVADLRVSHLYQANTALSQLRRLCLSLLYKSRRSHPGLLPHSFLLTFSDASTGTSSYGQTGFISGLLLPAGRTAHFH